MKNLIFERRLRAMRTYHANERASQFDGGVRVFHRYDEFAADDPSWWDDCQIIVNRRRVMIWWVHPRFKYRNAIEDAAWAAAGEPPERGDWLAEMRSRPVRKKVGKSRTRIVAYEQGVVENLAHGLRQFGLLGFDDESAVPSAVDEAVRDGPIAMREDDTALEDISVVARVGLRRFGLLREITAACRRTLELSGARLHARPLR